ncbi:hypothetical protein CgunFtcFv8_019234 [Champsocephalus gunnari]|uniref:Uncharacterized protein n=1 Tax=Champsocephalus gunnari TaxID=52237 RepID=A0AAN8HN10_CHAGU|nr:hypothetical protein CgunFtcFv8_019234 [Champsocephalus gunnari]
MPFHTYGFNNISSRWSLVAMRIYSCAYSDGKEGCILPEAFCVDSTASEGPCHNRPGGQMNAGIEDVLQSFILWCEKIY